MTVNRNACLALLGIPLLSGCLSLVVSGQTSKTNTGSTGTVAASSSTGGTTQAPGTSSTSAGTTGSSGTSTTGGAGTSGSSTGSGITLLPAVDGGYVFCALPSAADAGPDGDGGPASWMCTPGTYLCDVSGNLGNCFQCLSDTDCTNRALPTYDQRRPYCDLHSGIPGYQNFCQECLDSAQCAGNPAGPFCDTDPNYPPSGDPFAPYGSSEPPIENLGFESCGKIETDCRVDGGRACDSLNFFCEQDSGQCTYRDSQYCATDADCVGVMAAGAPGIAQPYCVVGGPEGRYCTACRDGYCPGSYCLSDALCADPNNPDAGQTCDLALQRCLCTDSAQCGGFWPTCELVNGLVNELGQPAGMCGCGSDAECGDAGLICAQGSVCVVPCTAPGYPRCSTIPISGTSPPLPICDPSSGLCIACTDDEQCRSTPGSGGSICSDAGACVCQRNDDCPASQTCQSPPFAQPEVSKCEPAPLPCNPASCGYSFCDWDSGVCLDGGGVGYPASCFTDYDCSNGRSATQFQAPFCDQGVCVACRTDQDCVDTGGNPGLKCMPNGDCRCLVNDDCPAGEACPNPGSAGGFCSGGCSIDSDCPANYFCDPLRVCRPRCDQGHGCAGAEAICDTGNDAGQNGKEASGAVPAAIWCYQCLAPSDCGAVGCYSEGYHTCGNCQLDSDCPSGDVCSGYTCHPTCDAGACSAGQVCDSENLEGQGVDFCYQCLSPVDCPSGEGCGAGTCGTCFGPNAQGGPSDCPPDDICSDYWSLYGNRVAGVCLADCDFRSCPADQPICAVLPALTPDHKYCFGCLQDSDCASLGPLASCDTSVGLTFTCQLPP